MNDSSTSLDHLHDIVVPAPVPIWPPAPGWYVVLALIICSLAFSAYHLWKTWRSNAYRREALRELAHRNSPAGIAQLLRRVALVFSPRSEISAQTGENWPEWLAARCPVPMPPGVRNLLANGVYRAPQPADDQSTEDDVQQLKEYAASWMTRHQTEMPSAQKSQTESAG